MINSFLFRKNKPVETNLNRAQMLSALHDKEALLWIDMESPDDFESEALVEIFNFHPLAVEDCVTDISHPKVDDYEEYLFMVVHAMVMNGEGLSALELDIFLSHNYVVTYHQTPIKPFEQIRETAKRKPEHYFSQGADMLVHTILDHLVDQYQLVLDYFEEKVDAMEEEIFKKPDRDCLSEVVQIKRDIFHFRRTVAPQRDTLNFLTRNPTDFIRNENMIYFRDVYDHLFTMYGVMEGYHESISGLLQAYFSYSSHRLNQTIQRMTVMATLSMPSLMIASIYGMNFRHMPELDHPLGYLFALLLMGGLSVGILIWMKWKKWI